MMKKTRRQHFRILAVAPSSRGFGFAVLEGEENLVDWGVRSSGKDKNAGVVSKVDGLIAHYQPGTIVLDDHDTKDSRRSARIRALGQRLIVLAENHNITVTLLSRAEVRRVFFPDGKGSKDAVAQILAKRFPHELESRLPPKRRLWMSEDYRMGVFDAVALGVAFRSKRG